MFEWYDFYIYGTLGAFLAKYFFSNVPAECRLHLGAARLRRRLRGSPVRGADLRPSRRLIGRKYTFLITMTLMGIGTFFIGLIPGFATWGILAPIVLIAVRLVQGLALGGEYGGAAIYVAEHAPPEQARLLHVVDSNDGDARPVPGAVVDPRHPHQHGRRRPSAIGAGAFRSCCPRSCSQSRSGSGSSSMSRRCSGAWSRKASSRSGRSPEAFGQWSNAKIALAALFGATAGEAVVWYGGQFYALFFLTQTLKVPGVTAQIMIAIALAIGTPCFILFGWLSDRSEGSRSCSRALRSRS